MADVEGDEGGHGRAGRADSWGPGPGGAVPPNQKKRRGVP